MVQASLFPWLSEELGPLTEKQQELVTILGNSQKITPFNFLKFEVV